MQILARTSIVVWVANCVRHCFMSKALQSQRQNLPAASKVSAVQTVFMYRHATSFAVAT